ncbi:MAG: Holliday junction branch migration protein RuvA [Alphaproteobacteria bacterium]|nr:Holliday junction branch migration protein RuvA [Alphaproteobacteria bacterium]
MFAKLTGIVDSTADDRTVIDVNGVGYLVFCSARTLDRLPMQGEVAVLHIETHVREDHINLYGFGDDGERQWFRLLITVQGVGARHAMAVLGILSPEELAQAIAAQDKATISRASGVGPKLAQRIASELKDKIGDLALGPAAGLGPIEAGDEPAAADAVSVLVNLGYRRTEAHGAVAHARRELGQQAATEDLVKAGLKELGA